MISLKCNGLRGEVRSVTSRRPSHNPRQRPPAVHWLFGHVEKRFCKTLAFRYIAHMPQTPPVVLTIAGFDPSSGAGIAADVKTIAAHGCYGVAAITALTVQSTAGVQKVAPVKPDLLTETLQELLADCQISAVHIGMLGSGEIANRVADFLEKAKLRNVVLDPILISTSETKLLDDEGIHVLRQRLVPLAAVITPNIPEATSLTGVKISEVDDMRQAASQLHEMGARAVVITGGHLEKAIDLLSLRESYTQLFRSDKIDSPNTHGTGCAFSTAIACQLAVEHSLSTAVLLAKAYVTSAITSGYAIGKGPGPVNHMYRMKNHPRAAGLAKRLASGKD
jgi:hydroxymethylpyrimidine/phosphomethylpyrimidine kinase